MGRRSDFKLLYMYQEFWVETSRVHVFPVTSIHVHYMHMWCDWIDFSHCDYFQGTFDSLLSRLSVENLLKIFASVLLERRIILISKDLRYVEHSEKTVQYGLERRCWWWLAMYVLLYFQSFVVMHQCCYKFALPFCMATHIYSYITRGYDRCHMFSNTVYYGDHAKAPYPSSTVTNRTGKPSDSFCLADRKAFSHIGVFPLPFLYAPIPSATTCKMVQILHTLFQSTMA